jgi:hypothetical protein
MTSGTAEGNFLEWEVVGGHLPIEVAELLEQFHLALAEVLPCAEDTETGNQNRPHEILLRDCVRMLGESPTEIPNGGFRHYISELNEAVWDEGWSDGDSISSFSNHCAVNDGVNILTDCCWNLKSKSVTYDSSTVCRQNVSRQCGFTSGNWSCMGRCGPGCISPGWYFKDCLDHDWCVKDLGASRFAWGPCANEFWHAADDFSMSVGLNLGAAWAISGIGLIIYNLSCQ